MADGKMNWYTLHVYSSMEKSVKNALEERIAQSGELRSSFGEVLLPTEKVHEVQMVVRSRANAVCTRAMSSFRWR